METAVIYARVSTEEQAKEGRSIPDQISKLTEVARQKSYTLLNTYRDEGFSGSNPNRPGLEEMLAFCSKNKVNKILVVDTDRIARDESLHFAIKAMLKKSDTKIESLNQPMIDDSPEGSFMDTIIAAVNAFQPKVTGRKASMSMDEKAKSGWWPGWAPLGYLNEPNAEATAKVERNIIVADPTKKHFITRMFVLFSSGTYAAERLSDQLYTEGLRSRTGKKLSAHHISFMLKNPFYLGKLPYKGNLLPGNHEPLIDQKPFNKCQLILASHNRYADRKRKHSFLLNGFVFCGICNQLYTAEHNTNKHRSYYHCQAQRVKHSNRGQNIETNELEKQVEVLFRHINLPQAVIDRIVAKAREVLRNVHQGIDTKRTLLEANKARMLGKRSLLEAKLLDGVIDDETYKRQSLIISADLGEIELELSTIGTNREENIEIFEKLLLLARNISKAYKDAPLPLKRRYLNLFWEKIIVEDRKIKEAIPTKAFQAIMPEPSLKAPLSQVISFDGWLPGSDSN